MTNFFINDKIHLFLNITTNFEAGCDCYRQIYEKNAILNYNHHEEKLKNLLNPILSI